MVRGWCGVCWARRCVFVFVVLVSSWFVAAPVAAIPAYSNLVVFGDSLVDAGNTQDWIQDLSFGLVDVTDPDDGYYDGRFTNYYNAADYLALEIEGAPTLAYRRGGDNYAEGGAEAADRSHIFSNFSIIPNAFASFIDDIEEQVETYLEDVSNTVDPNALHLLHIGGNDAYAWWDLELSGSDLDEAVAASTGAILASVSALLNSGAEHVFFAGVSNPGPTPVFTDLGAAAAAEVKGLARRLQDAVVAALPDSVVTFDEIDFIDQLIANPEDFGLGPFDAVNACFGSGAASPLGPAVGGGAETCLGFSAADTFHPTSAGQEVLAQQWALALPEGRPILLVVLALASLFYGGKERR